MNKSAKKILLLGAGELGKELVISLKRLGQTVIAVDRYADAPAMQVADAFEVINMLDSAQLRKIVKKYNPDLIVPEIEAIRTTELIKLEEQGFTVIPSSKAVHLTMNRDAIRDAAANDLGLKTASFAYAESELELRLAIAGIGLPCVIKPVMSSSGKGQSVIKTESEIKKAWQYACTGGRGDRIKVIVEEFIDFDYEITLLTVKLVNNKTIFVDPIGHRQERGDYQESWMPMAMSNKALKKAQGMAKKVTDYLGGRGIFGVEFFVKGDEVWFSELSPRPHDTGMVTLISQNLSEFDLHARAILGFPIRKIQYYGSSASSVILAGNDAKNFEISGLEKALDQSEVDIRIFGKPDIRKYRRMGVALARGSSITQARRIANKAAAHVTIIPK